MKKLLLVPIALFSLAVSAQSSLQLKNVDTSAPIAPNSTISAVTIANGNTKVNIDLKNISNSGKTYTVKRYDALLNVVGTTTADAYFCFGGSCYGDMTITSPNNLALQAGKSASDTTALYCILTADLDEASAVGLSVVKYTFYNVNLVSDSVQITIKYNGSVGINSINKDVNAFDIFPNPASENAALKISATSAFESKVTIYNSLGAIVSEKPVFINNGRNSIDLKIENLSPGLYFVNLKTNESSVVKRLIVK